MYQHQNWKDRAVQFPRRFREVPAEDGTVDHINEPGAVIEEGTPYCAETMQNMEQGILAGNMSAALALQLLCVLGTGAASKDGGEQNLPIPKINGSTDASINFVLEGTTLKITVSTNNGEPE